MMAGADFIKTSTGKEIGQRDAPVSLVMAARSATTRSRRAIRSASSLLAASVPPNRRSTGRS